MSIPKVEYSQSRILPNLSIPKVEYSQSCVFQKLSIPEVKYSESKVLFKLIEKWVRGYHLKRAKFGTESGEFKFKFYKNTHYN